MKMMTNRLLRRLCPLVILALCAPVPGNALAQAYPNKPIRIIATSVPGGTAGFTSHLVGEGITEAFGQQVIVDFRGGAAGIVGTEIAAKAPPDGYTVLNASGTHTINPGLHRKLPFDTEKDFSAITQLVVTPFIFVVHPSVPVKTVKELIALAKSRKGGLTYASAGSGAPTHLGTELLKMRGGFDAVHVPYKGSGSAMIAILSGEVDMFFASMIAGLSHVKSGKVRAIAVTSLKRSQLLPDFPSIAESGFPGFSASGWQGLLVPAGTSRDIISKLYDAVSRHLARSDVRERLVKIGVEPVGNKPEEFSALINSEMLEWASVIKQSGARPD